MTMANDDRDHKLASTPASAPLSTPSPVSEPPKNLPDDELLGFWRSVYAPKAELTGPLIRYAGLVVAAVRAQCESDKNWLRAQRDVAEEKLREVGEPPQDQHLRDVAGLLSSLRDSMAMRGRIHYGEQEWLRTLDVAVKRLNELAALRPSAAPVSPEITQLRDKFRKEAEHHSRLAAEYEAEGERSGNQHAELKARRICNEHAAELDTLLSVRERGERI